METNSESELKESISNESDNSKHTSHTQEWIIFLAGNESDSISGTLLCIFVFGYEIFISTIQHPKKNLIPSGILGDAKASLYKQPGRSYDRYSLVSIKPITITTTTNF